MDSSVVRKVKAIRRIPDPEYDNEFERVFLRINKIYKEIEKIIDSHTTLLKSHEKFIVLMHSVKLPLAKPSLRIAWNEVLFDNDVPIEDKYDIFMDRFAWNFKLFEDIILPNGEIGERVHQLPDNLREGFLSQVPFTSRFIYTQEDYEDFTQDMLEEESNVED